jgi:putative zinc finger/helix-turn-helix YgiT family protein
MIAERPNLSLFCGRCFAHREASHATRLESHTVHGETFEAMDSFYVCLTCGEELDDPSVPDMMDPVFDAYRTKLGLLSPAEIVAIRESTGLSQVAFATLLGMSPATICGYERGNPHRPKEDVVFRLCRLPGAVRMLLRERGHLLKPGQRPTPTTPASRARGRR